MGVWVALALLALALPLFLLARHSAPSRTVAAPWIEPRPPEEEALRRAMAQHPEDPTAHLRLGEHYLRRVLPFEAIWELEETLALRPDDGAARAGLAAALDAVSLPDMAREQLQQRAQSPAGDLERRLALARLELRYGEADAASQALRGAEDRLAASPEGLLVQGRVLQASGDRATAEADYRRHLKLAPASAEGYYRLGRLLLEAGRRTAARAVLTDGRHAAPADARFPFYLGLSYLPPMEPSSANTEHPTPYTLHPTPYPRARALFEEAMRLAPHHALPLYQLGLLEQRAGQWEAAARDLNAAVEADPGDADAYRELARALTVLRKHPYDAYYRGLYYSKVERPVEAVREFRMVANARPDSAEGPLLVSRMFIQTMQYAEAAAVVESALRRFPQNPELYEQLAALDKFRGSYGTVEQLCRQWRAALPKASEPYWLLGKLRVAQGRLDEGIHLYEQALAMEPDRADYLLFLGQALAQRAASGDLLRALDLLGRAVQKAPQDPAARFQLGLLLQRLDRSEETRDQMLRALDLDPHQAPPYNSLVQMAAQLRRSAPARFFAQAVRHVEAQNREEEQVMRGVWTKPRDPDAHLAAARFRRRTGDLAKAKAHLEQALELRPGWPEAAQELGRVTRALEAL